MGKMSGVQKLELVKALAEKCSVRERYAAMNSIGLKKHTADVNLAPKMAAVINLLEVRQPEMLSAIKGWTNEE